MGYGNTYTSSNLKIDEMLGKTYVANNTYEDAQIVEGENIVSTNNDNQAKKTIKNIEIKQNIKEVYVQNLDNLDVTNGILVVNYNDGTKEEVKITENMISGFNNKLAGTNTLTLTYRGNQKYTFDIDGQQKDIYEEMKLSFNVYIVKRTLVHHYIENTTQKIAEDEIIYSQKGKVFDNYETNALEDIPNGYELVNTPENNAGTMLDGTTEVTYYYADTKENEDIDENDNGTNNEQTPDQGEAPNQGQENDNQAKDESDDKGNIKYEDEDLATKLLPKTGVMKISLFIIIINAIIAGIFYCKYNKI